MNKDLTNKVLWSETITYKKSIDETVVTKDEKGNEIKTIKKIEKECPLTLLVKKPSRKMKDMAGEFYAIQYSKAINSGILPRWAIRKLISEKGGLLTDNETRNLYGELLELENKHQRLSMIPENERTQEEKDLIKATQDRYIEVNRNILKFENTQESLFSQCAESVAGDKLALFWYLFLTQTSENNSEPAFYFTGDTFEERYAQYIDKEDEDDELFAKILERVAVVIALWRNGMGETQEDLKTAIDSLNRLNKTESEEKSEEKTEEKAPVTPSEDKKE
jgi:hypothetical protein